MKKATEFLSKEEVDAVQNALRDAELNTSGEIVPVISSVSGRYDRAEDIFGLIFSLLALSIIWLVMRNIVGPSDWTPGCIGCPLNIVYIILIILAGFAAGTALAVHFPTLKLPLILGKEIEEETEHRATECFFDYGIGKTRSGTGILIYISLYEHRVVVKGDHAISAKLKDDDWKEICNIIINGIKKKKAGEGLVTAISKCGEILKANFPPTGAENTNELVNKIHFID